MLERNGVRVQISQKRQLADECSLSRWRWQNKCSGTAEESESG